MLPRAPPYTLFPYTTLFRSELRAPGESLEPGQIYESNRTMVAAVLASAGAEVVELPVARDDEDSHRRVLVEGLEADVLVTRSEEHTSELQSLRHLVCRLLLE